MSDVYDVEVSIKINGTNHMPCIAVSQLLMNFDLGLQLR